VRGAHLAERMSNYLVRDIGRTENIHVRLQTEVTGAHGTGRLEGLTLRDRLTGKAETLPGALFAMIGATPFTDWLADTIQRDPNGFVLTGSAIQAGAAPRWPLERAPQPLELACQACSPPTTSAMDRSRGSRGRRRGGDRDHTRPRTAQHRPPVPAHGAATASTAAAGGVIGHARS
jgi:hypothetical protein